MLLRKSTYGTCRLALEEGKKKFTFKAETRLKKMTIAVFIDADNLSKPHWIDQAFEILKSEKQPVTVRRAYGDMNSLNVLRLALSKHDIDQFPNRQLGKNTTDTALVVGVMAFAYSTAKDDLKAVVIGSGDADFAPLAFHLQSLGIKVICLTIARKATVRIKNIYDQVIFLKDEP